MVNKAVGAGVALGAGLMLLLPQLVADTPKPGLVFVGLCLALGGIWAWIEVPGATSNEEVEGGR